MNTPPPINRFAGKRFYISSVYSDKQAREDLTNGILKHGGTVVGHWLSADYYVTLNYNKQTMLGAEVINANKLVNEWLPEAVKAKLPMSAIEVWPMSATEVLARQQQEDGRLETWFKELTEACMLKTWLKQLTEATQEMRAERAPDNIQHTLDARLDRIEPVLSQLIQLISRKQPTDPLFNDKRVECLAAQNDEKLAIELREAARSTTDERQWGELSRDITNRWIAVAKKSRALLQPSSFTKLTPEQAQRANDLINATVFL